MSEQTNGRRVGATPARALSLFAAGPALAVAAGAVLMVSGCAAGDGQGGDGPFGRYPKTLSAWGLFTGDGSTQTPQAGVEPYDLNTPLFSDYALKFRFVRLPVGPDGAIEPARYREQGPFEFPVGTVIAKTFAYPADFSTPAADMRLLETRLLIHEEEGWVGLPYIWNEQQSEAELEIVGGPLDVSWLDGGGRRVEHTYRVPNVNQCKTCHRTDGEHVLPIGPRAGQLNRDFVYAAEDGRPGRAENQLDRWRRIGFLEGAPQLSEAPRVPVWNDPSTGSVAERARTWLDINCAHCHNLTGSGRTSGLDLRAEHDDRTRLGIYKHPVAAGRGAGDRLYGVVPGKPEESILVYRLDSVDPGVMMPELGRALVDTEAVDLVREWIRGMDLRSGA